MLPPVINDYKTRTPMQEHHWLAGIAIIEFFAPQNVRIGTTPTGSHSLESGLKSASTFGKVWTCANVRAKVFSHKSPPHL
jgi:hypothetical protein